MRMLSTILCFFILIPGVIYGQTTSQQANPSPNNSDVAAELRALREALLRTQDQVAAQQQEIESLKAQLKTGQPGSASLMPASFTTQPSLSSQPSPETPSAAAISSSPALSVRSQHAAPRTQNDDQEEPTPATSIRIGSALLTPGGFVDFENIFRTTNTQNNIATAFATIPFSNTQQGHVSEWRTTAQFSRLNLKMEDSFHGTKLMGYIEGDFSGNNANNVYQSTSNLTNRLRLYFGMAQRGKWQLVGGQVWSWLTPNREGTGPIPSDLAITYNEDQNIGVGLPYTRAAEYRAAYHFNDHFTWGVGIEASNQYIGNYVALPVGFTSIGTQFDNNAQIGAPNFFPDLISKATYDGSFLDRHFHAEIAGVFTGAHATVQPVGQTSFESRNVYGGGGDIAGNYELIPNKLVVLANAFWSDGGAHYLVATGPQLVVRPNAAGTDVSLSMVHAGAGSAGFEWRANPKEAFAVYYGADYYGRNFFPDTTNTAHPGTIIGYGGPGSSNINNRTIQQVTFDWLFTFWKSERHGAFQYYTQYSYLTRSPWYVAPGDPKNAHLSMIYAGVRYVLPSTSGVLLRVPYPN